MTDDLVPPEPSPAITAIVAAIIRHVLAGLGAVGVGVGSMSDSNVMIVSGVIAWLAMLAWAIWQKYGAQRALTQAAYVSARKRQPLSPAPPSSPP